MDSNSNDAVSPPPPSSVPPTTQQLTPSLSQQQPPSSSSSTSSTAGPSTGSTLQLNNSSTSSSSAAATCSSIHQIGVMSGISPMGGCLSPNAGSSMSSGSPSPSSVGTRSPPALGATAPQALGINMSSANATVTAATLAAAAAAAAASLQGKSAAAAVAASLLLGGGDLSMAHGHGHGHGHHGLHGHHALHGLHHSHDRSGPYGSPPPPTVPTNDPTANECKLIDYRGAKVAAFVVAGDTMLCLPQAFELFLKHLVGGLHTVYTKLKRLDITPIVCNVEQVRILRGLGAIQPGVNRCKLLSCKDFDVLYKDCTTASSRPGRPPKRVSSILGISSGDEALLKLKKSRLENGEYGGYENGHLAAHLLKGLQGTIDPMMLFPLITGDLRMEKSPLLANGYNHPPTHINPLPFMALNPHGHPATAILSPNTGIPISSSHPSSRSDGSIIKERTHVSDVLHARSKDEKAECDRLLMGLDHRVRDLSQYNGSPNGHSPVLNLSKNHHQDLSDCPDVTSTANGDRSVNAQALSYNSLLGENSSGVSSIETLLRNIQGLLKVAADNARQQERQINYEKAELKMEILREREVRESLEKQLIEEQRTRVLYQKRLRREKKIRRRLHEQLDQEAKRRSQYEEALKSTSADTLRILNESLSQDLEADRGNRAETERKLSDSRVYYKNPVLFSSAT
ncbi:hypothetical protein CHUAL_012901 [Chamberlinius hualienensis]